MNGLNADPGLAQRLRHVVELVAVEVEAADQREYRAVVRSHRHERRLGQRHLRDRVLALVVAEQRG